MKRWLILLWIAIGGACYGVTPTTYVVNSPRDVRPGILLKSHLNGAGLTSGWVLIANGTNFDWGFITLAGDVTGTTDDVTVVGLQGFPLDAPVAGDDGYVAFYDHVNAKVDWKSVAGTGTVTSVGLALPTNTFDITGSPVTAAGTLTATFDNQTAHYVLVGPATGDPAAPTWRLLVATDLPSHEHAAADVTSGVLNTARLGTGVADSTKWLRGDSTWQILSVIETDTLQTVTERGATSDRAVTITATNSTTVPFTAKGAGSQSANLTDWKSSADAVLASISSAGKGTFAGINIGTAQVSANTIPYNNGTGDLANVSVGAPLSWSAPNLTIPQANGSTDGFLDNADWTTFNAKESVLTFSTPLSRAVNTVSIPQANGSTDGFLDNGDWTTFNGKENVLTFNAPLSRSVNAISIPQANGSTDGFLDNLDWTTFNDKMTNPMTTQHDLVVGGVAGAPARLGKGSANQVLTTTAGLAVAWQDPSAVSESDTLQTVTTRGATSNVPITLTSPTTTSIPLSIVGASGQTYDLQQWSSHPSTVVASIAAGGKGIFNGLNIGTTQVPTNKILFNNAGDLDDVTVSSPLAFSAPTLSIAQANGATSGYLSSGDWTTFNGKENVLSFSAPLSRSVNTVSIPQATSSVDGFLDNADWTTFNGKMTNPMTTQYDLVLGGVSGSPVRLAKGADNNVLVTTGGVVQWGGLPAHNQDATTINSGYLDQNRVGVGAGSGKILTGTAGTNAYFYSPSTLGIVEGSGTVNRIPKWATSTTLWNTNITELAGGNIGISVSNPALDFQWNADTNRTIGMGTRTVTDQSGFDLTVKAGDASWGQLSTVSATAGGSGYAVGNILTVTTGNQNGQVQIATIGGGGSCASFTIASAGTGYATGSGQATTGGTGTGCTVNVTAVTQPLAAVGGDLILSAGKSVGTTGSSNIYLQTAGVAVGVSDPVTRVSIDGYGTTTLTGGVVHQSWTTHKLRTIVNTQSPWYLGNEEILLADTTLGNIVLYLPNANQQTDRVYRIRKTSAANTVTINRQGSDVLVDALTSITLRALNESLELISNGTSKWELMPDSPGAPPVGMIQMWSGARADIPWNYLICDGTGGTPNLQSRFIMGAGAGGSPEVGSTGGSSNHSHSIDPPGTWSGAGDGLTYDIPAGEMVYQTRSIWHTHYTDIASFSSDSQPHLPNYYVLAFIKRVK